MCLTRLLSPDVYGITGMIMSVFYMINMVTDIGLQAYVVRHHRSDDPEFPERRLYDSCHPRLDPRRYRHAPRMAAFVLLASLSWRSPLPVSSLFFVIDGQVSLHQFRGLSDGQVQRYSR